MQYFRDSAGRKAAAAFMAVVFSQGLVGALAHFDLQAHVWCPRHEQITHDLAHATDGQQSAATTTSEAGDRTRQTTPSPNHDDDHDGGEQCQWLAWLHNSSISTPALQPELPTLPALEAGEEASPSAKTLRSARAIPLEHVSPINSPPLV